MTLWLRTCVDMITSWNNNLHGLGALHGKYCSEQTLLEYRIIVNNKIDAYLGQVMSSKG